MHCVLSCVFDTHYEVDAVKTTFLHTKSIQGNSGQQQIWLCRPIRLFLQCTGMVNRPASPAEAGLLCRVDCCIRCLAQGVSATHIIDGRQPHSLLMELLTDTGVGTMITG